MRRSRGIHYRSSASKATVARLLTAPSVGRAVGRLLRDRVPSKGLIVDTSSPIVADNIKAQLLFGLYESTERKYVRKYLSDAPIVLDLGASLGIVSTHALRVMAPEGHLIAVEPNSSLHGHLRRALRRGSRGQRTSVVHAAIGARSEATARLDTSGSTVASHISLDGEEVPVASISSILTRFGYNDRPYALIADIEGAEAKVLDDDLGALANCTTAIIEFHDWAGSTVPDLARRVEDAGFEILEAHGPVVAFRRVVDPKPQSGVVQGVASS